MDAETESRPDTERRDEGGVKQNVKSRNTWLRLLYMVLFALVLWLLNFVLAIVVVVQFLIVLVSGGPNRRLVTFGHELGIYYHDIVVFLTFKTEVKPFPFSDWRSGRSVE